MSFVGLGLVAGVAAWTLHWQQTRPLAKARQAYARRDWQGALALALPLLADQPDHAPARLVVARCLYQLGRPREGEAMLEMIPVSELEREDLELWGRTLTESRKWARGIEVYSELCRRFPSEPTLHQSLAVAQFQAGQVDAALESARRLAQFADHAAAAYCIQGAILEALRNEREAAECFTQVLELDPEGKTLPVPVAQIVDRLVSSLASLGRFDEAEQRLRQAIAKEPTAELYNKLAELLVTRGDPAAAREQWLAALRLDKQHAAALEGLGRLALGNRQPAEAIGWLKLAKKHGSTSGRLEYMLSTAYRQLGRADLAEAHALEHRRLTEKTERQDSSQQAVVGQSDSRAALLLRARHALESREWREAEGCLIELERQYPGDAQARGLWEELRALRGS